MTAVKFEDFDLRSLTERLVLSRVRADERAEAADERAQEAEHARRRLERERDAEELWQAILGHDLRNPLAAIKMGAEILENGSLRPGEEAVIVRRIRTSAERMDRMVAQLLDVTRARLGGELPIERHPADLGAICQAVAEELGTSGHEIHLEVRGDVSGHWDADRITQAVSNLVGNATEYAEAHTAVDVLTYADGPEVALDVVNQGNPIPIDILPFIFDPFRRGRRKSKSKDRNHLGLGLYIASQAVQSHGGTLSACSSEGRTTFSMRLPRQA